MFCDIDKEIYFVSVPLIKYLHSSTFLLCESRNWYVYMYMVKILDPYFSLTINVALQD